MPKNIRISDAHLEKLSAIARAKNVDVRTAFERMLDDAHAEHVPPEESSPPEEEDALPAEGTVEDDETDEKRGQRALHAQTLAAIATLGKENADPQKVIGRLDDDLDDDSDEATPKGGKRPPKGGRRNPLAVHPAKRWAKANERG